MFLNTFILISCLFNTFYQKFQEDLAYYNIKTNSFTSFINLDSEYNKEFFQEVIEDKCTIRESVNPAGYYHFLPVTKAKLMLNNSGVKFTNSCFKTNKVRIEKFSRSETIISLEASEPVSWFCSDTYIISTFNLHQVKFIFQGGERKIIFTDLCEEDLADISVNGITVIGFCHDLFTTVKSIWNTLKMFIGGMGKDMNAWIPLFRPKVPEYMEKANVEFLDKYVGYKQNHRGEWGEKVIEIDEKKIKSGDFLAVTRLDGLDPVIMFGTGARLGHCAMFLWFDDELYVIESTDGVFWPKSGIQKIKYREWLKYAHDTDKLVAYVPLKEEYRAKFDEKKAVEFFNSVEGLSFGYHNFVFSWIDTEADNIPIFHDTEPVLMGVNAFSKLVPSLGNKLFGEALNKRLDTKDLTVTETILLAAKRGISVGNLFAMPEQDWDYSDGKSFVCSAFTASVYKAAGIFGDFKINPFEISPRDMYQLAIFDREYKDKRPEACKEADPDLGYCQIMGKYQVVLDHYSTIELYDHMNEKCPSVGPLYLRPEQC
jgi:hypothetical protein